MKALSASLLAASLLSIAATLPVQAGSMETPMLFLSSTTNQLVCIATNSSTSSALTVKVKIIGNLGGVATETCTLPANDIEGCQVVLNDNAGRCRISNTNISSSDLRQRARGVMFTRNTPSPSTIEAVVEAR